MGTESQRHSQQSGKPAAEQMATAAKSDSMPAKVAPQPLSMAPSAIAEQLDDGWGEEDSSAALAPAKLPTFEQPSGREEPEATATAAKAAAKPLQLPTNQRSAKSRDSSLALQKAGPAKAISTLPPGTTSVVPKALSSVPPAVDDESDWDLPSSAEETSPTKSTAPSEAPQPTANHGPVVAEARITTPPVARKSSSRPPSSVKPEAKVESTAIARPEPKSEPPLIGTPVIELRTPSAAVAVSAEPVAVAVSAEPVAVAVSAEPVAVAVSAEPVAVAVSAEPVAVAVSAEPVAVAVSAEPVAVIVSEVQTSMAPVVTVDFDVPKQGTKLWVYVAAVAAVVGVVWGVAGAKNASRVERLMANARSVAATPKPEAPKAQEIPPQAPVAVAPTPDTQAAPPTTNDLAKPASVPEVNSGGAAPDGQEEATPDVTKVRIEVVPTDSTVALYGKRIDGPLVFDVKKGTRTVLEVGRPGYITRRIVLDGKKKFLRIAMTPTPKPAADPGVPSTAEFPATTPATP